MFKNTRFLITILIALALVIGVTVSAASKTDDKVDFNSIFEGKNQEQVKMELLEVENYKYEKTPLTTIKSDDYKFDIYRVIDSANTALYGFYIVATDISTYTAQDGEEYYSTGLIDFQLYEADSSGNYQKFIEDIRLTSPDYIQDLGLFRAYLPFKPTEATDYALVIDSSRAEEAFKKSELAVIHLNSFYDANELRSAEQLTAEGNLADGFSGDFAAAGYGNTNSSNVLMTAIISTVVIMGLAVVVYVVLETYIFKKKSE